MRIGSYGHVKENPNSRAEWTVYHNPKCSKSRCALDLLRAKGIDATVVDYQETPLKKAEIEHLIILLKIEPKGILRADEDQIKAFGINVEDKESVINAIVKNPELLQRPIIVHDGKAIIGRPPEKVWDLM